MAYSLANNHLLAVRSASATGEPLPSVHERLSSRLADDFRILGNNYLHMALNDAARIQEEIIVRHNSSFFLVSTIANVAVVVAFFFTYWLYYRRQIQAKDLQIKEMRSWLALLPAAMIMHVPWLHEEVRKLLNRNQRRRHIATA